MSGCTPALAGSLSGPMGPCSDSAPLEPSGARQRQVQVRREPSGPSPARVLVAFGVALAVLASPARLLWAHPTLPWFSPFVAWGAVILLGAWAGARPRRRP